MTHEELVKEIYEVSKFLMNKQDEIRAKYYKDGNAPEFENGKDDFAFSVLESALRHDVISEFDSLSGYRARANEFTYEIGDGVKAASQN